VLTAEGLSVRMLVINDAKDPDNFIRYFEREKWDEAIREAISVYDFELRCFKADKK